MVSPIENILNTLNNLETERYSEIIDSLNINDLILLNTQVLPQILSMNLLNTIRKLIITRLTLLAKIESNQNTTHPFVLTNISLDQQLIELSQKIVQSATKSVVVQQVEPEPITWFSTVITFFVQTWSLIINFFSKLFKKNNATPAPVLNTTSDSFDLSLNEDEEAIFEAMRKESAQYTGNIVGKTGLGEEQARTNQDRSEAILGRYGMMLSSQVIAGTRSTTHSSLSDVAVSLVLQNDDNRQVARLYHLLTYKQDDFLKKQHVFSSPGNDLIVSEMESHDLKNILANENPEASYGFSFSTKEKAALELYKKNNERSKFLNHAIGSFAQSWGGYEEVVLENGKKGYKKCEQGFEAKQKEFETKLKTLSKTLLRSCAALEEEEAIFFDTGLEGHAMKIAIQRLGNEFKLTCYDSSGALENSENSKSLIGLLKLQFMGYETKRSNALSFTIPRERLLSQTGFEYFNTLIKQHSFAGWAETSIAGNLSHTTREERSRMGIINTVRELRNLAKIYLAYLDKFTSIELPSSPHQFDTLLQNTQNTENCFAKRVQSCQLYELGKPTYKKLRRAQLIEQKNALLNDIIGKKAEKAFIGAEYHAMLKNIPSEILSPDELYNLSLKLCEISEKPSTEYYESFFQNLLKARLVLVTEQKAANQLAIQRIDLKLASHLKSYYFYLLKGKRFAEMNRIFSPQLCAQGATLDWNSLTFDINSENFPLNKTMNNAVDHPAFEIDENALEALSEYATAQAWKASIQLINHQIQKLSVKERFIHSSEERLASASFRQIAQNCTLEDLEQANIVQFITGYARKEKIKIELNCSGQRKEIGKDTFFKLILANKKALTNPQVVELLDYLRNLSPAVAERFNQQIYPAQFEEMQVELSHVITQFSNQLINALEKLDQYVHSTEQSLTASENQLQSLELQLIHEKNVMGPDKNSLIFTNLQTRKALLIKERTQLLSFKQSIITKKNLLSENHSVEGSLNNKITKALDSLNKLNSDDPELQTTRVVTNTFVSAQSELARATEHLNALMANIEIDETEKRISDRTTNLNEYRFELMRQGLQTNSEFRLVDGLASGQMGTEKDRSRALYIPTEAKKSGYLAGSVFAKIHDLSKNLRHKIEGIIDYHLITEIHRDEALIAQSNDLLLDAHHYNRIENQTNNITKSHLPQELKSEYLSGLFEIWMQHENPENLLFLSKTEAALKPTAIKTAFINFLEQKANIKYAAFNEAFYPHASTYEELLAMGWKDSSEVEFQNLQEQKVLAAQKIMNFVKEKKAKIGLYTAKTNTESANKLSLAVADLGQTQKDSSEYTVFKGLDTVFLSLVELDKLGSSTLKFLRDHPAPQVQGSSEAACLKYYQEATEYLNQLKNHETLENKRERVLDFCRELSSTLPKLSWVPSQVWVDEIAQTLIDEFRDEEGQITKAIASLENSQRKQLLKSLLRLALSQLQTFDGQKVAVSAEFYSIIKHWEKFLVPADQQLSESIAQLSPTNQVFIGSQWMKELDRAIQESVINIEGISEGQKGLQFALTNYGKENGVNSNLRKLADRLTMRNGENLLAQQFIDYYSDAKLLFSNEGINSTQGREFFSRAYLDAYQHADIAERNALLQFLQALKLDSAIEALSLKTPHKVFKSELLMQCALLDSSLFVPDHTSLNEFIEDLTDTSSTNAEDRLFGFAKRMNLLALKIQKSELQGEQDRLNLFYSRFICANLAYQTLLEQASEEVLVNLNENFEFQREMNLVTTNRSILRSGLMNFSSHMELNNRAGVFKFVFQQFNEAQKFDGPSLQIQSPTSLDIPGFIKLAGNKSLDVIHGVVYAGNNKLGFMPTSIQSHDILQRLDMSSLPYRLEGNSWCYIEDQAIKALVTPLANGELIVQRQLKTLDGTDAMLQYLSLEQVVSLPVALKTQMNAAHFFMDSKGLIHGYSNDFKPLLKLSLQNEQWTGLLIDHHKITIPIRLDKKASALTVKLASLFPYEEMVSLDDNRVYIPSLKNYVIFDHNSETYFISQGLQEQDNKRILKWTENGTGYTEQALNPIQVSKVIALQAELIDLQQKIDGIKSSDLLSIQQKNNLKVRLKNSQDELLTIKEPLHFIFVPESHEMITYRMDRENKLLTQEFQSLLHVGKLPGKTALYAELLGKVILKSPMPVHDFENLKTSLQEYQSKETPVEEDLLAIILLMGIEIQHHLLEREQSVRGKKQGWDKERLEDLLASFSQNVKDLHSKYPSTTFTNFSEFWNVIESEFTLDSDVKNLWTKVTSRSSYQQKPININAKINAMPIELLAGRHLIEFIPHQEIDSLIDEHQKELKARLNSIDDQDNSVQKQEAGFYYEQFGLFNLETLTNLFRVSDNAPGIKGLSQQDVSNLFNWLLEKNWIKPSGHLDHCQLYLHPSEFYSEQKLAAYLAQEGLNKQSIKAVANRLEHFLYDTAVSSGVYAIQSNQQMELADRLGNLKQKFNLEVLEANEIIESLLAKATTTISRTELNAAFLLNDYSRVAFSFPETERTKIEIALNNALTRAMYYQTELDHLKDVQNVLGQGKINKAIGMLHTRRNYNLDSLFASENPIEETTIALEQTRKMQRAFLMFEYQFGHRCNARQVDVFRGLLIDNQWDPEKIDSAQARMGFGKTTLLPLVALYKTGTHLVRFIVPKSALETNTSDMSASLNQLLGSRAIKDDFQRYKIEVDPEMNMGDLSPRLKSLQDQKADLKKRLSLYERVKLNKDVLIQAPHVRNSLECQTKIYLDLLLKLGDEPKIKQELLECITLINQIRSLITISVFDELDATQNSSTTDVNYPSGDKSTLDIKEIDPLELITHTISAAKIKNTNALAKLLLKKFKIDDSDETLFNYVTSLNTAKPLSIKPEQSTAIYLIRAVLTDPVFLSLLIEKEPSTDFGVWFEHLSDGTKGYDYHTHQSVNESGSKNPLLIAIPYSAANTPKSQGTRFDNPEVTAVATFLYYLDRRTLIEEVPHFEYLIQSFKNGTAEEALLDSEGILPNEFLPLVKTIRELAQIEDAVSRNEARKIYFEQQLSLQARNMEVFRRILARTIVKEQIQFDSGKANSKRYEQGTVNDQIIGFSGTVGDTSPYFKVNKLDPAADGNLTLGIMGRSNCQKTITLDTRELLNAEDDFTQELIAQLALSFTANTRALIDAGGLSKAFNREVARAIALQLKQQNSLIKDNGVIFYDDITNTKKLLILNSNNEDSILDLTEEMLKASDLEGRYFTYFDHAHSRGADIKQMDNAEAIVTLNFNVTNNDYKQAIMRMRKIVDKNSGQSFIPALTQTLREQILVDLNLEMETELTGNDIAYWLREKELKENPNAVTLLTMELDAVVKNAILQQQAQITEQMQQSGFALDEERVAVFSACVAELNAISPFISGSLSQLEEKYGKVLGKIKKEVFVADLKQRFEMQLTAVFVAVENARTQLGLESISSENKKPYYEIKDRILNKREPELMDEFEIPSSNQVLAEVVSEVQVESQSQSQSQAQVQAQTHSFSQVAQEPILAGPNLTKAVLPYEPVSIAFLEDQTALSALPLASQIKSLQHLFLDSDAIYCGLSYQLRKEANEPCPPLSFVLVRDEGTPRIILINQDEADLVKGSGKTDWSLYNLSQKQGDLVPLVGTVKASLTAPLLKKLQFASYQYEIKGNSLETMAQSLSGLATLAQLKPSLAIQNEEKQGDIRPLFHLPEWGFSGTKIQTIPLQLEPSREVFNNQFEKTGTTIHLGQGEHTATVFISSKLDKRILTTLEQGEQAGSLVKQLITKVDSEYNSTKVNINKQVESIHQLKDQRQKISDEMDAQLLVLKERRDQAIQNAQHKTRVSFEKQMEHYLGVRKLSLNLLQHNLYYLSRTESFGNGLVVGGRRFSSIGTAITTVLNELSKQPENLDASLTKFINQISEAAHELYRIQTDYTRKQGTLIESLKAALPAKKKGLIALFSLEEVKIWGRSFGELFEEHFIYFNQNDEVWNGLWNCFEKAMADHYQGLDFEKSLTSRIEHYANHFFPNSSEYSDLIKLICYTSHIQNFICTVKEDIQQSIILYMKGKIESPSPEQEVAFLEINKILNTKMKDYELKLPQILLDYKLEAKSEQIQAAVVSVLEKQNIRASAQQVSLLTRECKDFIKAQKIVQELLENFSPTENRSVRLGEGIELDQETHQTLVQVDEEVMALDQELAEIKALKKSQLAKIDDQHKSLKANLLIYKEQFKELKAEKKACNKLRSGLSQFGCVFSEQQVTLAEQDPDLILDRYFDVETLIKEKASASANLSFVPPEFYSVENDMREQERHKQGLNEKENPALDALNKTISTVHHCAGLVQKRDYSVDGILQISQVESHLVHLSQNRSSLWTPKTSQAANTQLNEDGFQLEK